MTDWVSGNLFVSFYEQEKETAVVCQMGHLVEQEEKSKVSRSVVLYLINSSEKYFLAIVTLFY